MKKSVLALSITAAVAALGFAGGAQAMTGTLAGYGANSTLQLNGDGRGHMLLVPYFTAQADNTTLINLVNTDTVRGKAVKVRFRGAANSDDIYDFQVFLSPGDVWTGSVSKGADGKAKLTTSDATCTKPSKAVLNATPFVTARLDPDLTTDGKANNTREGYIEIFTMADIPKTSSGTIEDAVAAGTAGAATSASNTDNALYTAIKHVSGVAPCSGSAWTNLDSPTIGGLLQWNAVAPGNALTPRSNGLLPPTTGLMANWTIINVVGAASWSGAAVAIQSVDTSVTPNVATTGNVVYWPQTATPEPTPDNYTADALLRTVDVYDAAGVATGGAVTAAFYDLPDMSTPYTAQADGAAVALDLRPRRQAIDLTSSIAATSATNEFLTDTSISASTDWVFSLPTRRYSMALDYASIGGGDDGRRFTDLFDVGGGLGTAYFNAGSTLVSNRQICVIGSLPSVYNREEGTTTSSTEVVVSPSEPAAPLSYCGEASVLSINNGGVASGSGALKASVALKDLDEPYRDGWMTLTTLAATPVNLAGLGWRTGLPVLGASFVKAWAGANSFGASYPHRFTR